MICPDPAGSVKGLPQEETCGVVAHAKSIARVRLLSCW
jgi:hypothetical protein